MSRYNKNKNSKPKKEPIDHSQDLFEPEIDYDFYLRLLGENTEKNEPQSPDTVPETTNPNEEEIIDTSYEEEVFEENVTHQEEEETYEENEFVTPEEYYSNDEEYPESEEQAYISNEFTEDYNEYYDNNEGDNPPDEEIIQDEIPTLPDDNPPNEPSDKKKKSHSKKSSKKKKPIPLSIFIFSGLLLVIILSLLFFVYMKSSGNLNLSSEPEIDAGVSANFVAVVPTATPEPTPEPTTEPTLESTIDVSLTNLLTGELTLTEEAVDKRPVAVMVSNVSTSFPQLGISYADVIFEIPVEGNITRFMALFGDYTQVPDLCSIRSCRYYYPMLSEGFDAIYVHWGMEQTYAANTLDELDVDNLNGSYNTYDLFGRNSERLDEGYNLEHTSEFYGTQLAEALEENDYRTDLIETQQSTYFNFSEYEYSAGASTTNFTIDFGNYYSEFTYNEEDKLYYKKQNGEDQIDGTNGEQLAFKNVLILETDVDIMPNYGSGVKEIDVTGENKTGYYISNGKVQQITWSKDSADGRIILYTETGLDLYLNTGKTYIAIADPGSCDTFN
ncbi:MAG: DUF3048 domain-containing protein [Clostridia bacterium]